MNQTYSNWCQWNILEQVFFFFFFLNAENHKTIPVRGQSKKLNPLSLLFCLPSAFHKDSLSVQALGFGPFAEDSGTAD